MGTAPSSIRRRAGRGTALATALAVGLTGLVAGPVAAAEGRPSDLVEACTDAPSAESRFNDYGSRSAREQTIIDCLSSGYKGNGSSDDYVLQGNGSIVSFDATISRAQFSAILNRVADHLGVAPRGAPSRPSFADVPANHFFYAEIEELFARGLTNGSGQDASDADGDGDTSEAVFNPNGSVSYAQVVAFVHRLLTDPRAGNMDLPRGQSTGQARGLDCGAFEREKDDLDHAGFLVFANTPGDCKSASPRGLVFDLIAVAFDQAVESDKITSPHVPTAAQALTISLSLDRSGALANEVVTATAVVKDADGVTVQGRPVDVFAVRSSDAFDAQGNPKPAPGLNVGGTNSWGTGTRPGELDANDPTTDGQGKAIATVSSNTAESYDVYAFTGSVGVVWRDVRGTAAASGRQPVQFTAVPTGITVSSKASPSNTLPYGQAHVVTFQLVDANGQPAKVAGAKVVGEIFRTDDCEGAPSTTAPCDGQTRKFATQQLTTDADGKAQWSVNGAPDPRPSTNGCAPNTSDCNRLGDRTTDRFEGTWDRNGNGLPDDGVTTDPDLVMTFTDTPAGQVQVASMRLIESNNPNKLDETGARTATPVSLEVSVTDSFGNPAAGVQVQFVRNLLTNEAVITTGSNGIATLTVNGPATPSDWTYTARVDGDGDGLEQTDRQATSPTNDTDLVIHWVGNPELVATYSNQDVVGYSTSGKYVDLHDAHVRVPYDSGDNFFINGQPASLSQFEQALVADAGSNDTVTVNPYQNSGISTFRLTVDGSTPPIAGP